MILVDTDHLSVLVDKRDSRHARLKNRLMAASDQGVAIPIISIEEQLRGWLAQLRRQRDFAAQVHAYEHLASLLGFLQDWEVLTYDFRSASESQNLSRQRLRIGTQDLKIAAMAIVNDGILLSANLRDFRRVPGLKVENWLE